MKILFVTDRFPYPRHRDGIVLIAFNVLRYLGKRHQVHLVTFDNLKQGHPFTLASFTRLPKNDLSPAAYYFSLAFRKGPIHTVRLQSPTAIAKLTKMVSDIAPDVALLMDPNTAGLITVFKKLSVPVLFVPVDAMSEWFRQAVAFSKNIFKKLRMWHESILTQNLEQKVYPKAEHVAVVSRRDQDALTAHGLKPHSVSVIPNGVDIPATVGKHQKLAIVFSGSMHYPPNYLAVMFFAKQVWPNLKKLYPNMRWYIVGKKPTGQLQALAVRDSHITVTGQVNEITPYLQKSMVYVAPIAYGTGMKNKILEAFAAGIPVVASKTAISGIAAKPGTHFLQANGVEELMLGIRTLIEQPDKREQISKAALELVTTKYSWSKTCARYEKLLTDLTHHD